MDKLNEEIMRAIVDNCPFVGRDKVKVVGDDKVYDFGYIDQTGKYILYEEGESNMQDSFAISPDEVYAVNEELSETDAVMKVIEDKLRASPFKVGESERCKWVSQEVKNLLN